MARIRTIKPEFWRHEDLSTLPEATHMLAAALLNYADDEGYFNANVKLIQAECSPLREPSVSIPVSLQELSRIGYLRLGNGPCGKRYGQIVNFRTHQVISHPKPSAINDLEILWEPSSTLPVIVHPEGKGREGKGKEDSCTKARSRVSYSSAFEDFWKAYPDTQGTSKAEAYREWQKLTEDEQQAASAGIPGFKAWIAKQGKDYRTVHPCRYLSQRRFETFETTPVVINGHPKVYVEYGTTAGDAWETWHRIRGRPPPRDRRGGWWFESEFPPVENVA